MITINQVAAVDMRVDRGVRTANLPKARKPAMWACFNRIRTPRPELAGARIA